MRNSIGPESSLGKVRLLFVPSRISNRQMVMCMRAHGVGRVFARDNVHCLTKHRGPTGRSSKFGPKTTGPQMKVGSKRAFVFVDTASASSMSNSESSPHKPRTEAWIGKTYDVHAWADTSFKAKYCNLGFDMDRFLDHAIAAETRCPSYVRLFRNLRHSLAADAMGPGCVKSRPDAMILFLNRPAGATDVRLCGGD
jgi:hypothetical protein